MGDITVKRCSLHPRPVHWRHDAWKSKTIGGQKYTVAGQPTSSQITVADLSAELGLISGGNLKVRWMMVWMSQKRIAAPNDVRDVEPFGLGVIWNKDALMLQGSTTNTQYAQTDHGTGDNMPRCGITVPYVKAKENPFNLTSTTILATVGRSDLLEWSVGTVWYWRAKVAFQV